jgi:hypothetical protein
MTQEVLRAYSVERWRGSFLQRMPAWFLPAVLVVMGLGLLGAGLAFIGERHTRRALEREVCAVKVDLFYARRPTLRQWRREETEPCTELNGLPGREEGRDALSYYVGVARRRAKKAN